jgi:hypothetical protein
VTAVISMAVSLTSAIVLVVLHGRALKLAAKWRSEAEYWSLKSGYYCDQVERTRAHLQETVENLASGKVCQIMTPDGLVKVKRLDPEAMS